MSGYNSNPQYLFEVTIEVMSNPVVYLHMSYCYLNEATRSKNGVLSDSNFTALVPIKTHPLV